MHYGRKLRLLSRTRLEISLYYDYRLINNERRLFTRTTTGVRLLGRKTLPMPSTCFFIDQLTKLSEGDELAA